MERVWVIGLWQCGAQCGVPSVSRTKECCCMLLVVAVGSVERALGVAADDEGKEERAGWR